MFIAVAQILVLASCHVSYGNPARNRVDILVGDMRLSVDQYNQAFKPDGLAFYDNEKEKVKHAMGVLADTTCLRFSERDIESDYVSFYDDGNNGCWSNLGRRSGKQQISLQEHCMDTDSIIHEILHAVGFDHEHQRPDRDEYITVLWHNIKPEYNSSFWTSHYDNQKQMAYGFGTVMHYTPQRGAVSASANTMEAKDPKNQHLLETMRYTKCDAERINVMYNCTKLITGAPECYKH